ncbi:glycoside hydrolase family 16 protein [Phycomyces blakesleeanus NRRL 1555(-)]|uniref:Glycoside hydrolase family 16 protein n=1 Tax=Phycomyces blakesleeanus (strain ATCC 8743b / DSM 1359 / FGSC 10004 / NBRC 33097 / NRRL 1555) TaxID=763407 RepID=A0A167LHA8_PHYB8|nr:glycoside hydrolase family 16 protein [Phycomyces blakesleeanus NRRL 1555(-)]OAD70458.1 glycoside hydrolase family 16 protein [Phycomyces blakesleeanus NRRL 1555(-)]|eukprot:XP_018288498.1 glycoside hydrolase family 16 protein [Phycomyces blakesleeanus NRRL 1555(-)]
MIGVYTVALFSVILFGLLESISCLGLTLDQCDCGFKDENDRIWTNMWFEDYTKDIASPHEDHDYLVMNYTVKSIRPTTLDRLFDPNNVQLTDGGIDMTVKSDDSGTFTSASFGSRRTDILYGTYRINVKTSDVPGTIAAMFIRNDNTEIDIELLSQYKDPAKVHYAVHPQIYESNGSPSPLTFGLKDLSFDPTEEFHEYRLDWLPEIVEYFTDGVPTHQLSKNIPEKPGRVVINHWTDGNPNFGGALPTEPAVLSVSKFVMMFNVTGNTEPLACQKSANACSIHDVTEEQILPENIAMPSSSMPSKRSPTNSTSLPLSTSLGRKPLDNQDLLVKKVIGRCLSILLFTGIIIAIAIAIF